MKEKVKKIIKTVLLAIICIVIGSYVVIIFLTNLYCQFNSRKCIEHDLGATGSWFEIKG